MIKKIRQKDAAQRQSERKSLIWAANCSPLLTTYGSVGAPAAVNIPGVKHSYTAGIGQQYGARMATAQTASSIRGLQRIV
jgi:hypothetical protein